VFFNYVIVLCFNSGTVIIWLINLLENKKVIQYIYGSAKKIK
jgi:hypothetical protein